MLTREKIQSGYIQELLRQSPVEVEILSDAEHRASRMETLERGRSFLEPDGSVWLFGYGSLIWNPCIHCSGQRKAVVHGYHRRFCLWTHLGRGTPENPGLVLGLEPGGSVTGLLFRIAADKVDEELEIIWRREMVTNAYKPTWVTASPTENGADAKPIHAITFVMNRDHPRYTGKLSEDVLVATLATARGELGSSAEYLLSTVEHLDEHNLKDNHLRRLARRVSDHPAYGAA